MDANVTVVVRKIPKVAVKKSGSIRISVPAETFVATADGKTSGRDQLTSLLQTYLNSSYVDVFTVIPGPVGDRFTDVRFAAHGSPYYAAEKMELVMARNKGQIQNQLGLEILMIHVDECLDEGCEGGFYNELVIREEPVAVMINTTSFVGSGPT